MFTRRILASLVAGALAVGAVLPASATNVNLNDGSCFSTGGSTFAPGIGVASTNGCSNHQRYLSTYWQFSGGGFSNITYGWKQSDWGQADPSGGSAVYMYSSHNLCTSNFSSCNAAGYVNSSAP